jgi:hypothetical protein
MGFYDRFTDRQPNSRARGFRRKEWLKDTVLVFQLYSRARVCNGDQHTRTVLNEIRPDPQQPGSIGDGAHRFDSIHKQIQKNLPQLNSIGQQLWKRLTQFD